MSEREPRRAAARGAARGDGAVIHRRPSVRGGVYNQEESAQGKVSRLARTPGLSLNSNATCVSRFLSPAASRASFKNGAFSYSWRSETRLRSFSTAILPVCWFPSPFSSCGNDPSVKVVTLPVSHIVYPLPFPPVDAATFAYVLFLGARKGGRDVLRRCAEINEFNLSARHKHVRRRLLRTFQVTPAARQSAA